MHDQAKKRRRPTIVPVTQMNGDSKMSEVKTRVRTQAPVAEPTQPRGFSVKRTLAQYLKSITRIG